MTPPLDHVSCASIAVGDLHRLGQLRLCTELRVVIENGRAWIVWTPGRLELQTALARCLLPLEGVELYVRRDGRWYRPGKHLPDFRVPAAVSDPASPPAISLARLLLPAATQFEQPELAIPAAMPVGIIRDVHGQTRSATAVRAPVAEVIAWADSVPSGWLSRLAAVWKCAAQDSGCHQAELLLIGPEGTLPAVSTGSRYFGSALLIPLGFRIDPELPEVALRHLVGARDEEILVWDHNGYERISRAYFHPLDRSQLALAGIEANGHQPDPLRSADPARSSERTARP